ncbi:Lipoteichoic acid synthase 2 [Emticicia aquatica]|uniref:Lipoteichoic acid synthase 2 n=1 Tax=Emticicia aquatica TaxID=1681835 RepID=A0ABN8EV62_9BACT|nr:Lipoteichoic acid synthase 2 [Emticicia aquatica]
MYLLVWLKRLSWLLICYFFLRFLFLIFNIKSFQYADFQQISFAFVYGIKFDLSAIFISNILFTITSLLPFRFIEKQSYQTFLKYIYWLPNIIFFWSNIADFEYYKFIGRRTIFEVFGIMGDVLEQSFSLLTSYWFLLLLWILLSYVFVKYTPNPKISDKKTPFSLLLRIFIWLLSIGFTILFFRGGFQEKPLRINQAFEQHDNNLGNLTLNTTFTFLTTIDAKGTEKANYFTDNKVVTKLIERNRKQNLSLNLKNQNVVIIILESFGKEYMGYKNPYKGYTPFLDSLSKQGVFMENCFANGRESIIAMPAITASIPQLIEEPFITSSYQSNKFWGLGSIVKQHGYTSSFFHGARNGSMGFEGFSQLAGFDKYYGINQYPKELFERDFDKNWGIFDEPYFQYFASELTKETKPFVSCIFTLSSHHPYPIPNKYKGKFPKGKAEIHESLGYTDLALKNFFASAAKQPWFKHTLFVVTADHTQFNTEPTYASATGAYRVPLIFYHPDNQVLNEIKISVNSQKICQHTDILPSVLDFLNIPQNQILPFGESVFAKSEGKALQFNSGIFRMISGNNYVEMSLDGKAKNFDLLSNQSLKEADKSQLKAFIQYYRNGLIENTWVK